MPKSTMLTGEDRVERSPLLGRAIRSGALAHLKVADQDRLFEWIRAGRTDDAVALLDVLRLLYLDMNRILLEWSLSWGQRVREELGAQAEAELSRQVHAQWAEAIEAENEYAEQGPAAQAVLTVLAPDVRRGRSDCQAITARLNAVPGATWEEVIRLVKAQDSPAAIAAFEHFSRQSRAIHDFLCQYLWVYPTVAERSRGQDFSERMMMESFQSCTMYEGFFKVIVKLSPEGLVALMSEHLRGHFSGPDRRGKVEIVETADSYRMILDACGSGGAMRRRNLVKQCSALGDYPRPTPSTWNLPGVPSYCAHCAQNEIFMVQRFGFPAWVVNYDPDPMKPCGWTVYKDYTRVPEQYYERIGFKKDPNRIALLPVD